MANREQGLVDDCLVIHWSGSVVDAAERTHQGRVITIQAGQRALHKRRISHAARHDRRSARIDIRPVNRALLH